MCGIAGLFYFNGQEIRDKELTAFTSSLQHRGPDAHNSFISGPIGLAHTRLSVIDPTERSNQPFISRSGRYIMVYNGEVYNFREIARDLNLSTHTTSDTEVILEAFEHEGPAFIKRLNGMFALAIYDKELQSLFLLRDRIGVKPLFTYQDESLFAFASEIKALLEIPAIKEKIKLNPQAVSSFLHLGYIPEPLSIYKGIHKFPAAAYASVTREGSKIHTYWQLKAEKTNFSFAEAKTGLKALLESAVNYRLISDVPFGIFLSGGIDSSLVTAIAQQSTGERLKTFSMKLADEERNESYFAKKVSDHLHTDHTEFTVNPKDIQELIPLLPDIFDEPFADSSCFPTLMISSLARKKVTMALSGDGGDELFLGYGAYKWADRLNNPLIKHFRHPVKTILSATGIDRYQRAAKLFDYPNSYKRTHIFSQEQYLFSLTELNELLIEPIFPLIPTDESLFQNDLMEMEQQAYFDLRHYLKDDLLVKVDRSSMHNSLEVREPLLDYRLVEYAYALPQSFKYKKGISKYILKEVLYEYLPAALFNRPKKGFSIPLNTWLKHDLKNYTLTYTSSSFWKKHGWLKPEKAEQLGKKYLAGHDYLYNKIWQLIVLGMWLEQKAE